MYWADFDSLFVFVLLRGDLRIIRVSGGGDDRSDASGVGVFRGTSPGQGVFYRTCGSGTHGMAEVSSSCSAGFVLANAFNAVNHRALFQILLA